jgi:hypothetical protein
VTLIKLTLVAVIGLTPVFYSAKVMAKGKEGAACKVVGGANKGKKGTYDADGDCAGSWGMTECGGANTGKCQDARKGLSKGTGAVDSGGIKQTGAVKQSKVQVPARGVKH